MDGWRFSDGSVSCQLFNVFLTQQNEYENR